MRAVVISSPGDPDVLVVQDVAEPEPSRSEVLVRVAASGLNRADLLQRRGFYAPPPGVDPSIPGLEYAGIVERVGPGVLTRRPGDRVMGLIGGAAYADRVVVHERETISVPTGMSLVDAASLPEVFLTAYDALWLQAGLQPGQWCLIRPVTSGVGIAACQLARALGARSIGTSRSAERLEGVKQWGLDVAVMDETAPAQGERNRSLGETVERATDGRGISAVLDMLGGDTLDEHVQCLASGGTIVVLGLLTGTHGALNLGQVLARRVRIMGTAMRTRPLEEKIHGARIFQDRLVPLFVSGALKPFVDTVLPPEQAGEGHRRMERNEHLGKILLRFSDAD